MIIVAMPDNSIRLFDAATLQEIKRLSGHTNAVYAAKISPDGMRAVSCSRDTTIRVWNLANGQVEWQGKTGGRGLADIDISPDGKNIAFSSWYFVKGRGVVGLVSLWDMANGKEIWRTDFREKPIVDIRFSPNGRHLAAGTWGWRVAVWNLDKKEEPPLELHFDDVPAYSAIDDIAFSPDGKMIAAATKNGTPRVWELETGKLLFEMRGHQQPVFAIGFSIDNKHICTGSADATVMRWDAASQAASLSKNSMDTKTKSIRFHFIRTVIVSSRHHRIIRCACGIPTLDWNLRTCRAAVRRFTRSR
ncbi:WD40 repeat domain-containing protein [candidate division KSB1 bacterium]|nr:WD40 repeat domain-containing protein [candidate division KSB1 bacterium]